MRSVLGQFPPVRITEIPSSLLSFCKGQLGRGTAPGGRAAGLDLKKVRLDLWRHIHCKLNHFIRPACRLLRRCDIRGTLRRTVPPRSHPLLCPGSMRRAVNWDEDPGIGSGSPIARRVKRGVIADPPGILVTIQVLQIDWRRCWDQRPRAGRGYSGEGEIGHPTQGAAVSKCQVETSSRCTDMTLQHAWMR